MTKKYKTAKQLQTAIDKYFDKVLEDERPVTYTGLAYALGFSSRQSIWEYSRRDDDLSLPIKGAMLRIEQAYEERLHGTTPTGAIFALKNRGWTDKQEIAHSGGIKMSEMSDADLDAKIAELEARLKG